MLELHGQQLQPSHNKEIIMLKNISRLEVKVNEKTYQFSCDMDSPVNDVKEALFQFQKYMGQLEDHIKAQLEERKTKENITPISESQDEPLKEKIN